MVHTKALSLVLGDLGPDLSHSLDSLTGLKPLLDIHTHVTLSGCPLSSLELPSPSGEPDNPVSSCVTWTLPDNIPHYKCSTWILLSCDRDISSYRNHSSKVSTLHNWSRTCLPPPPHTPGVPYTGGLNGVQSKQLINPVR